MVGWFPKTGDENIKGPSASVEEPFFISQHIGGIQNG